MGFAGPKLPGADISVERFVSRVVVGGGASVLGGGKFANGAATAAFGYLFNEMAAGLARGTQGAAGLRGGILGVALSVSGDTQQEYIYVTYYCDNDSGEVYAGRTGGYGDPDSIVLRRAAGQPILNAEGFGRPVVDAYSTNYSAIRGREQQLIDFYGGARSVGGFARNAINGVSDWNPNRPFYMNSARREFGDLPDNSPRRFRLGQ